MDELIPVEGFKANEEREYFESRFTFPAKYKKQITSYLRMNKSEIVKEIIEKALDNGLEMG